MKSAPPSHSAAEQDSAAGLPPPVRADNSAAEQDSFAAEQHHKPPSDDSSTNPPKPPSTLQQSSSTKEPPAAKPAAEDVLPGPELVPELLLPGPDEQEEFWDELSPPNSDDEDSDSEDEDSDEEDSGASDKKKKPDLDFLSDGSSSEDETVKKERYPGCLQFPHQKCSGEDDGGGRANAVDVFYNPNLANVLACQPKRQHNAVVLGTKNHRFSTGRGEEQFDVVCVIEVPLWEWVNMAK